MTIDTRKNKAGEVTGYRLRVCVGRDEQYKQVWRTCTIPRPEGLTPAKERKEVQRIADEWEAAQKEEYQRTNAKTDKSKITFADFIETRWIPDHVLDGAHKPAGVTFYKYISTVIIAYFGRKKQLTQIDTESVKRFIGYLNKEARTQKGEPYSAETRVHVYNALRNILNYAKRMHYIKNNPCDDLLEKEKPHKEKKAIDFLDPEQAREFLYYLDSEPFFWRVFVNVLLTCGLRRGECVGLQWRDIDDINPNEPTLSISRNVTIDRNSPEKYSIGTTKTGVDRVIPLSSRVYGLLMDLKHEREEQLQAELSPDTFIFCRDGEPLKPLYPTSPTKWLRRFVERHDLPDISPHDLRHSAATIAMEAGASLKQVQQLLGHSNATVTMQFYAGVSRGAARATVDGIERILG